MIVYIADTRIAHFIGADGHRVKAFDRQFNTKSIILNHLRVADSNGAVWIPVELRHMDSSSKIERAARMAPVELYLEKCLGPSAFSFHWPPPNAESVVSETLDPAFSRRPEDEYDVEVRGTRPHHIPEFSTPQKASNCMRRTSDLKELSPEATKLKEKLRKQRENKLHGEDRSSGLLNGKFDYYGNEYQLPTEPEHKEYPRVYQGIWEPIKNTGLPKDSRRDRRKVTPVQQGRYYSRVSEDSRGKTYKEDYPTRTSSWRHRSAHRSFQRSRSRTRSRSPLRQHMSRPTRRYSSLQHPSPHRSSTHHKPHFPDYTEAIESKSKPLNYSDEIRLRSDNLSKRRDREKMNENIGHRTACSWEATQGPSNRPDVMNSTMNVDKEYDTNFVIVPELGKVNNDRLRLMMTEENQVVQRFHEHKVPIPISNIEKASQKCKPHRNPR